MCRATPGEFEHASTAPDRGAGHPSDRPARSGGRRASGRRARSTTCIGEINASSRRGERVLVTTLTKKMAEDLTDLSGERRHAGAVYAPRRRHHRAAWRLCAICAWASLTCWSASTCCARAWIFPRYRWWRSSMRTRRASCARETSLIQTIGRAARNEHGKVIMYADAGHALDGARDRRDRSPPRHPACVTMRHTALLPRSITKECAGRDRDLLRACRQSSEKKLAHEGREAAGDRPRLTPRDEGGGEDARIRASPPSCATRSRRWRKEVKRRYRKHE